MISNTFRTSTPGLPWGRRRHGAAACVNESGHSTVVSAGDGEVVSKEVGEEEL